MKNLIGLLLIVVLIAACGAPSKKEQIAERQKTLINELKIYEDSLAKLPVAHTTTSVAYAERCLSVYRALPNSDDAPKYLDKAHMIFASAGLHEKAAAYADTVIKKYPRYKNRIMVLQSLATTYDVFLLPRRKDKVKYYYELLLKENPNFPASEKASIQFRLKNIDLTFEELIKLQAKNA